MAKRLPRTAAIFDVEKTSTVTWRENLFAEPGDPDQFITADVGPFMVAQREALKARCDASGGREVLVEPESHTNRPAVPKGWSTELGSPPKRWTKTDPRKVFSCVLPTGDVSSSLAIPPVAGRRAHRDKERQHAG